MKLPLTQGAYTARNVVASAQRCVNLFGEPNPQDSAFPFTFYHTPGLVRIFEAEEAPNAQAGVRCTYTSSLGGLYAVLGQDVYYFTATSNADYNFSLNGEIIGSITTVGTPVKMKDNGIEILIVDGSPVKYTISISPDAVDSGGSPIPFNTFTAELDDAYYGSDSIAFLDGFFVLNRPGTRQFYSSNFLTTTFEGLSFASKLSDSDLLVSVATANQVLFLHGKDSTEVWYNAGEAFPFARMQGAYIEYGSLNADSLQHIDSTLIWLSRNDDGQCIFLQSVGYGAKRISTFAIENEISNYKDPASVITWTYQLNGHNYYVASFPSGKKTWVYDLSTGLWHEWLFKDDNGVMQRHRGNCHAFFNGRHIVGDWENPYLYELTDKATTDDGQEILRLRSFPHMVNNGERVKYTRFQLSASAGQDAPTPDSGIIPPPPAGLSNILLFGFDGDGGGTLIDIASLDEDTGDITYVSSVVADYQPWNNWVGEGSKQAPALHPDGDIIVLQQSKDTGGIAPFPDPFNVYLRSGNAGACTLSLLNTIPVTNAVAGIAGVFTPDGNNFLAITTESTTAWKLKVFEVTGSGATIGFNLLTTINLFNSSTQISISPLGGYVAVSQSIVPTAPGYPQIFSLSGSGASLTLTPLSFSGVGMAQASRVTLSWAADDSFVLYPLANRLYTVSGGNAVGVSPTLSFAAPVASSIGSGDLIAVRVDGGASSNITATRITGTNWDVVSAANAYSGAAYDGDTWAMRFNPDQTILYIVRQATGIIRATVDGDEMTGIDVSDAIEMSNSNILYDFLLLPEI